MVRGWGRYLDKTCGEIQSDKKGEVKAHEVPLTSALVGILEKQPKCGPFAFGPTGLMQLRLGSREKNQLAKGAGVDGWRIHDLRRISATRMTEN